ncbi:MAG: serine hydrolase [Clostridia bacterium]|nr:serine hydrolase [Clostridia bacterium]
MNKSIPRAVSAESVGLSSPAVQKMVGDMASHNVHIHSLMILRHGQVACEAWSAPLTPDTPHMAYSVSKSFLSAAYGFALDEGRITPDCRFLDVFPELRPKRRDENLEKLTIDHLMTMTSGKRTKPLANRGGDWLRQFVQAKWDFAPGEGWRYVNENYYAASAMLHRVLGEGVNSYLIPRLYEPLGIDVPFWETSLRGVEAGGWGLALKTEDIAKFILCVHNGGVYGGRQVIPEAYLRRAVSKLSDTSATEKKSDARAGYGCGFWRCAGADAFRCEGMYSQYAISFPAEDACFVMTSDHSDLQETLDCVWRALPDLFCEPHDGAESVPVTLPPDPAQSLVVRSPRPATEQTVGGHTYRVRRKWFINHVVHFSVGMFPLPILYFSQQGGGNIDNVRFDFDERGVTLQWTEDGGFANTLFLPMDGTIDFGTVCIGEFRLKCRTFAYWEDDRTLVLRVRALAGVAERILRFRFNGRRFVMKPDAFPGTAEKAKMVGDKLKGILVGNYYHWWINRLVPKVDNILNPRHHGRQIN